MSTLEKPRIMIADDEARVRAVVRKVIEAMGAELVAEARDGFEALDLFVERKPDLLLLDVRMPGMNGKEVLAEIMDRRPDACVIMLTNVSESQTVIDCLELGAAHYLPKDTNIQDMKRVIKETWEDFRRKKEEG